MQIKTFTVLIMSEELCAQAVFWNCEDEPPYDEVTEITERCESDKLYYYDHIAVELCGIIAGARKLDQALDVAVELESEWLYHNHDTTMIDDLIDDGDIPEDHSIKDIARYVRDDILKSDRVGPWADRPRWYH